MTIKNETVGGHAQALYRGVTGKTFQGEEQPGPELRDLTGIIPAKILAKINELSVRERQRLLAELR
jgi:hypothetical protein